MKKIHWTCCSFQFLQLNQHLCTYSQSTKARILHDRTGEVVAVARQLSRGQGSENKDPISHWLEAENRVVTDTFKRQLAASLSLVSSLTV